jgi:protein-S-isoprenylcysteine O-methyltransferase Ste14
MKATVFEFRFRFWIIMAICILGFVAPWDFVLHLDGAGPNGAPGALAGWGGNAHVWGLLAVPLSKGGAMSIAAAFNLVLAVAIVCAFAGAWLRTWGSAYLGADVMRDTSMRSDGVVADGPYRTMRNPLYLGSWLNLLAMALLMPASGAVFAIMMLIGFHLRLILGEEAFLRGQLGEPYAVYCAKVPRILPALRPQVAASGARPRWGQAALAEIFMWGSAVSFAVLGWRYNTTLLLQWVLVSLGVALVVKAFAMGRGTGAEKTQG